MFWEPASVFMAVTKFSRWVEWLNSTEEYPHDVTDDQVLVRFNTDFSMSTMTAQE